MVMMLVVVVVTAAAVTVLMVMVVLMVMMLVVVVVTAAAVTILMVMMVRMLQFFQRLFQCCLSCHSFSQLRAGQLIPGRGYNGSICIMLAEHCQCVVQLLLSNRIGTGQDYGRSCGNLVNIELAKILQVNLHLTRIHNRHSIAQCHFIIGHLVHGSNYIRQLADAGGFDDDPVRIVLGNHLFQRLAEITHQAAANASGIHFCDVDTGILQKAAVDADLTKFIFDQHQLLPLIAFGNHLFDQRGFTGAQKAGINVDFCHIQTPSVQNFHFIIITLFPDLDKVKYSLRQDFLVTFLPGRISL